MWGEWESRRNGVASRPLVCRHFLPKAPACWGTNSATFGSNSRVSVPSSCVIKP